MMDAKRKFALVCLALVVFVSACTTSGKLSKRYKSGEYKSTSTIVNYVQISGYSPLMEPMAAARPKLIFDLSEDAQTELIKQSGGNQKDNAKLFLDLAGSLSAKNTSKIEVLDLTRFSKRVTLSVSRLTPEESDRIISIATTLSLPSNTTLLSCDRLETKYEVVNIAKQNYSNSMSASLTGTAGTSVGTTVNAGNTNGRTLVASDGTVYNDGAGTTATNGGSNTFTNGSSSGVSTTGSGTLGVNGNLSGSRNFSEERILSSRIVSLQASITKNDLKLYQQSASGQDLVGNVTADIIFDWKGNNSVEQIVSFSELMDNSGTINKKDKIKVKDFLVIFPNLQSDIEGELNFKATYRRTLKGDNTHSEADDVVEYLSGSSGKLSDPITMVHKEELRPKMWTVNLPVSGGQLPLQISTPSGGNGVLIFNSATQARGFIAWLRASYNDLAKDSKLGTLGHKVSLPAGLSFNQQTINQLNLGIY